MNGAPQEIKVKINESRLLKFYPENSSERKFKRKKIQVKENSTVNSAEKNLKEDSNSKNFETFR